MTVFLCDGRCVIKFSVVLRTWRREREIKRSCGGKELSHKNYSLHSHNCQTQAGAGKQTDSGVACRARVYPSAVVATNVSGLSFFHRRLWNQDSCPVKDFGCFGMFVLQLDVKAPLTHFLRCVKSCKKSRRDFSIPILINNSCK